VAENLALRGEKKKLCLVLATERGEKESPPTTSEERVEGLSWSRPKKGHSTFSREKEGEKRREVQINLSARRREKERWVGRVSYFFT